MSWEVAALSLLLDVGAFALLYGLLAVGKLRQESAVKELITSYDKSIESKNEVIKELSKDRNYWRDNTIRLLETAEQIAGQ